MIYRRLLTFFLSITIILSSFTTANASVSSWAIKSAVSRGARVVVNATNSGYKSAVSIAPNAGRIAISLARSANTASLIWTVANALGDGIDWVLDPDNNSVKYKVPAAVGAKEYRYAGVWYPTLDAACAAAVVYYSSAAAWNSPTSVTSYDRVKGTCRIQSVSGSSGGVVPDKREAEDEQKEIKLPKLANTVAEKAAAGNKTAQDILKAVAIEAVIAGDFDADLLAGAVPISDKKPLVPSVPVAQQGDIGAGTLGGGDVGAAADAARDAADAAGRNADAAKNAAADAAADAIKASDNAKDLINQSIDQAIKDAASAAAVDAANAATEAQKVANEAIRAADRAAAEAVRASDKATAEAVRVSDKAIADLAAAVAAGASAEAIAAAEAKAAAATADKVAAEVAAEVAKEKAKEAEKAAEKAKEEITPFELPPFCSWAAPVCDAVEWLMKPAPDLDDDTMIDIDDNQEQAADTDINFGGSCPANFEVNSSIFGNPINITLFDTSKFCSFLSTFVKYPVYAASSLFAIYILGGRKDV